MRAVSVVTSEIESVRGATLFAKGVFDAKPRHRSTNLEQFLLFGLRGCASLKHES
jgi:hypothetical protein